MDMTTFCAGRTLDALIAEKLMGWRRTVGCDTYWETVHRPDGTTALYKDRCFGPVIHLEMAGMPHYSTLIEAAWEVHEKMLEDPNYKAPDLACSGPEAALRICRSALTALFVSKE